MTVTPSGLRTSFTVGDWGLLAGPALIWGASFLLMAVGLDAFEPGLVTFMRVGFGFAALVATRPARRRLPRADLWRVAALGVFWIAFPMTLFPIAQQWINSSVTGMLNSAMPLFTVLISWLVFRVATTGARLLGVLIGFGGILMIGLPTASIDGTSALGVGLVLLAVCSYGVAVNIAVPLQQAHGSLPVLAHALGVAAVLTLPGGIVGLAGSSFAWPSLVACVVLGVFGTGVAFVLAATLGGRHGPVPMSIITYLMPIVSIVLGVVFRDETVGVWALVGTAVVLAGAWITTLAPGGAVARRAGSTSQMRVSGRT